MNDDTVLQVAQSAHGKRWQPRCDTPDVARALAQQTGVADVVAHIAAGRGITPHDAALFFNPTLRQGLPNPDILTQMPQAVTIAADALQSNTSCAVFGDYDVDGSTSAAQLVLYWRALGQTLRVHIPDRILEGYGPNVAALQTLADAGVQCVITVDCGSTAGAVYAAAPAHLQHVILDHHQTDIPTNANMVVVNPNRPDDTSGLGHITAAGLVFLFLIALNRELRQRGFFTPQRPEPDLRQWLDLAALGTVCDVAPLTGINRVLVAAGLKVLKNYHNIGLRALAEAAQTPFDASVYQCGFVLGPRINAGGRVGRAHAGVELLTATDPAAAYSIAEELCLANDDRKELEQDALLQATAYVEAHNLAQYPVLLVPLEGVHPGVIGIAAARLREQYDRPTMIVAFDSAGIGKGSGRSMRGVNLGEAVRMALAQGLLQAGGGHAMAAGLTVQRAQWQDFVQFMHAHLEPQVTRALQNLALYIDGFLSPSAATPALLQQIEQASPYGMGNPAPCFAFGHLRITYAKVVGQKHVRWRLSDSAGQTINAIVFRGLQRPESARLLQTGARLHVAGELRADNYSGGVQLQVEDYAFL